MLSARVRSMRSAREHEGAELDGKKGCGGIGRGLAPFNRSKGAGRRPVCGGARRPVVVGLCGFGYGRGKWRDDVLMREGGEGEAALRILSQPMLEDDGWWCARERWRLWTKESNEWRWAWTKMLGWFRREEANQAYDGPGRYERLGPNLRKREYGLKNCFSNLFKGFEFKIKGFKYF
jgi:hypothetical protein